MVALRKQTCALTEPTHYTMLFLYLLLGLSELNIQ